MIARGASLAFALIMLVTVTGVVAINPYHADGHLAEQEGASEPMTEEHRQSFNLPEEIFDLTGGTFHERLSKSSMTLVIFYVPWSPSSQAFHPRFLQVCNTLWKQKPKIRCGAIDLEKFPEIGKQYRINSFPTLTVFRGEKEAQFGQGIVPRDMQGIVRHMNSLLGETVRQINSKQEAAAVVDPTTMLPALRVPTDQLPVNSLPETVPPVFFAFLESESEIALYKEAVQQLALKYTFVWTDDDFIAAHYKRQLGEIVCFGAQGELSSTPQSHPMTNRSGILPFVIDVALPRVGILNDETRSLYVRRRRPLLVYFSHHHSGNLGKTNHEPTNQRITQVYAALRQTSFEHEELSIVQASPFENELLMSFLNLYKFHARNGYALGLFYGKKKYRYEEEGDLTVEKIRHWLKEHDEGKLTRFFKSQHHGEDHPDYGAGRAFELVHSSFERLVLNDSKRDAVILFYKPDDRMCKPVLDLFDEVARHFIDVPGLLVGTYDITQNDLFDEYPLAGVPTIVFGAADDKRNPIRMAGIARTLSNVVAFVNEHASQSSRLTGRTSKVSNGTPPLEAPRRDEL